MRLWHVDIQDFENQIWLVYLVGHFSPHGTGSSSPLPLPQALMFMHVRPDHTLTVESAWKSAPGLFLVVDLSSCSFHHHFRQHIINPYLIIFFLQFRLFLVGRATLVVQDEF